MTVQNNLEDESINVINTWVDHLEYKQKPTQQNFSRGLILASILI